MGRGFRLEGFPADVAELDEVVGGVVVAADVDVAAAVLGVVGLVGGGGVDAGGGDLAGGDLDPERDPLPAHRRRAGGGGELGPGRDAGIVPVQLDVAGPAEQHVVSADRGGG